MKKTKIVCTLGPASDTKEILEQMVDEGMNVARFNFSHGSHEAQGKKMQMIRDINEKSNKNIAILLDTKGPEIRTHLFSEKNVLVKKGSTVRIAMEEVTGTAERFSVTYSNLINDIEVGGTVLIDDGYLELTVKEKDMAKKELVCIAVNSHSIKDRRGVNIPNVVLNMPFISEKDKSDLIFGCEQKVDFIAASFVRRKSDIDDIKEILKSKGMLDKIKIIAKVENVEGVDNILDIIESCDGIMVARGDLGVEVPAEEVPVIQKHTIMECHRRGKIVITATQMLESMQNNPRPTRAEVSDVANAVLDGTDAVMLSGESAAGNYPVESVRMMSNICKRVEDEIDYGKMLDVALSMDEEENSVSNSIALAVAESIIQLDGKAIVTPTTSGMTARLVSKFRPTCPIIALTECKSVARGLAINFGVYAHVEKFASDSDKLVEQCRSIVKDDLKLKKGEKAILTAGLPIGTAGSTNTMRILKIK